VVDREITHPTEVDFYLVSHASIRGVSRPTKYRLLWNDDDDMTENEIEEMTYYLCHMFSRCTRSVSYPAPTYYAHLAAKRARVYLEGKKIKLSDLKNEQQKCVIMHEIISGHPMFFV
jgi:eukaryotic translation initiation factor 2C